MRYARASIAPLIVAILVGACGGDQAPPGSGGVPDGSSVRIGSAVPGGSGDPAASTPLGEPPAATTMPAAAEVGIGAWISVQAEGLNLRERPGTGSASFGLLPSGSQGLVVSGPQEADGYTWYALAAPGLPYASGCITPSVPNRLECPSWFGWAAVGDANGSWVVPAELQCPAAPTSVAEYITIQPGVRMACFAGVALTLDAFVAPNLGQRECVVGYALNPPFLFVCVGQFLQADESAGAPGEPEMDAYLHPDLGACDFGGRTPETCPFAPHVGRWIKVVGHVDDAAAAGCAVELPEATTLPDPAMVIYTCRTQFVVTEIQPTS